MHISYPYKYDYGYIGLADIQIDVLPESVTVEGSTLLRKIEFHISLLHVEGIAQLIDATHAVSIEAELVERFATYITDHDLSHYGSIKHFRLVERADRKSLILMTEVPGLVEFFNELSEAYAVDLPVQPTHITLYTLQPDKGIGLLSDAELERDSREVVVDAFDNMHFKPIRGVSR
jgi:hypothetical protein